MTEERNYAILFAATILAARKVLLVVKLANEKVHNYY